MAVPADLLLSALSGKPDSGCGCALDERPLTSEPAMDGDVPLTSEPPLAAEPALTSEPAVVVGAWAGLEPTEF